MCGQLYVNSNSKHHTGLWKNVAEACIVLFMIRDVHEPFQPETKTFKNSSETSPSTSIRLEDRDHVHWSQSVSLLMKSISVKLSYVNLFLTKNVDLIGQFDHDDLVVTLIWPINIHQSIKSSLYAMMRTGWKWQEDGDKSLHISARYWDFKRFDFKFSSDLQKHTIFLFSYSRHWLLIASVLNHQQWARDRFTRNIQLIR